MGTYVFTLPKLTHSESSDSTCESLPEAHKLLRAFNAVCRIAAPLLVFKSEAIVHPDEVVTYIDRYECHISYNPLQMALTWEGLATRNPAMLSQALERRHNLHDNRCCWVNYVVGETTTHELSSEESIAISR